MSASLLLYLYFIIQVFVFYLMFFNIYTVKPDHGRQSEGMNVFIRSMHLKHIAADEFANHTTVKVRQWYGLYFIS